MSIKLGQPIVVSDMQGPCDDGFHIPLSSEWGTVYSIWTGLGGGSSAGTNFGNALKLPFAGYRNDDSNVTASNQGTGGYYWYSSSYSTDSAYSLLITSGAIYSNNLMRRTLGFSIRGFKNSPVTPTNSWTKLYGTSIEAGGIFWNSTDGLISLSSNGSTWVTIQDKNVGATTVWNSGDTLSESNCGKYFQRGNCYGFPWTGTVTTSSTLVNAGNYGPGNYYSSSTFINNSYNGKWDSSNNTNLRGGVSKGTSTVNKEVKHIYVWVEEEIPYLCFTANTANSTIQLTKNGTPTEVTLETSTDGSTRTTYTFGDTITLANIGDRVYFRNTSTTDTGFSIASNYYRFAMTGSISGGGDITTLINKSGTTTVSNYCFYKLFQGCTALTTPPELPATTLGDTCYGTMFYGCTSLTTVPKLPATTLVQYCYNYMFSGCTALNALPKLPATTLPKICYQRMFNGCTNIKLSTTQTGDYQTEYRIPTTGTGTLENANAVTYMFTDTGGTFTGTPTINTTYYTSNTVV